MSPFLPPHCGHPIQRLHEGTLFEPGVATGETVPAAEAQRVAQVIASLNAQGVTILLVEHTMRVVMSLCHDILVLNFGARIAEGTPAKIRATPAVIEAYLGAEVGHA